MGRMSGAPTFVLGAGCYAALQLASQEVGTGFLTPTTRLVPSQQDSGAKAGTKEVPQQESHVESGRAGVASSLLLVPLAAVGVRGAVAAAARRRRRQPWPQRSSFAVPMQPAVPITPAVAASIRATATSLQAKKSVEDLSEADIKGKKILIRCDLNVPLNSSLEITDETRITASIPTIEYLCSKGAKVIACSHLGRPKDGPEDKFSLKPVAARMGELMKKDIKCAPDCKATDEVKKIVDAMAEGDVLILENTRFYKGETKNDAELAESMARLADVFVNDAFGTAHRAHSSTEGVTK
eukprot:CAMPEP_0197870818 /NCGR_PEP_ID=MMETSP1439-20131203/1372_1 /TAXON_ID=66791 /ORGANISM="Gonyaulax spinifera, Strain CCMP409" /LENGTH=295 /DNA_ID=CAMNT_0043489719 /DNA_START=100 /DNA_END=984 /DNA_ORIENTATION=+